MRRSSRPPVWPSAELSAVWPSYRVDVTCNDREDDDPKMTMTRDTTSRLTTRLTRLTTRDTARRDVGEPWEEGWRGLACGVTGAAPADVEEVAVEATEVVDVELVVTPIR